MILASGSWPFPMMIGGGSGRGLAGTAPWSSAGWDDPVPATGEAVARPGIAAAAQMAAAVAIRRRGLGRVGFIAAPIVRRRATLPGPAAVNNRAAALNLAQRGDQTAVFRASPRPAHLPLLKVRSRREGSLRR